VRVPGPQLYGDTADLVPIGCHSSRRAVTIILLQSPLREQLLAAQDSVRFSPLCAACVEQVETIGGPPPQDVLVYVV
jgi:hypothetical protein